MAYAPAAGDLIWADFDPRVGREQSGRRPALVVSPADFCRVTEFAIVCPITSHVRPFGTNVVLPMGLPVSGEILTSHVRSIDTLARPIGYAGAAVPAETLHEVRMKLVTLMGLWHKFVAPPPDRRRADLQPDRPQNRPSLGSTEIGKLLMEQCAGTVKKLSLELGVNAPFIVFDDAGCCVGIDNSGQPDKYFTTW